MLYSSAGDGLSIYQSLRKKLLWAVVGSPQEDVSENAVEPPDKPKSPVNIRGGRGAEWNWPPPEGTVATLSEEL